MNINSIKVNPLNVKIYGTEKLSEDFVLSIKTNGVLEPLIINERNIIISGHRRFNAAKLLNLNEVPVIIKHFNNDLEEKEALLTYNKQREKTTSQLLRESEEYEIIEKARAKLRMGAKNEGVLTLAQVKNEGVATLPQGKTRDIVSAKIGMKKSSFDNIKKVYEKAKTGDKTAIELMKKVDDKEMTINRAYKDIKKEERKKEEREKLIELGKSKELNIDFRFGDFEKVFKDIKDNSIDCIITDPPYPFEFIECWTKLSRFAKRVLKKNSFCIAYSGQMNLPEVIKRMNENLDYYWTFAVYHQGATQIVNGVNIMCRWKPVLIYQNGKKKLENTIQDYFISEQREKSGHDWQQSESGIKYLIEKFTNAGDILLDPFAGNGTTLKVGRLLKRNVLGAEINQETFNIAKGNLYE